MYFNFNEINIMLQNLTSQNKEEFVTKLYQLKKYTKDAMLLQSINTLTKKMISCSDKQFQIIYQDIKESAVSSTDGYDIPD